MNVLPLSICLLVVVPVAADPIPIQCIVDVHCDPMAPSETVQAAQYLEWVEWVDWGLTEAEAVGGKISFLSTGQFMEWVLENPNPAESVNLIPRLAASGDNFLGTHSHQKHRVDTHNWPELGPNPTDLQIEAHWIDHQDYVNLVIQDQLGVTDPSEILEINCVRGAHLPHESNEELFQELAVTYGFPIREQGPDEAFFEHFDHFVWHPYRPSTSNLLVHDPEGPMIVSPFGPVLGKVGEHHGVMQDMSDRAVQGRFVMELLNWLDEAYLGDQPHVWTTGWSSHCHDLLPGNETHDQWAGMFQWMTLHFVSETVSGMQAVEFSTMKASAALHEQWEMDYPNVIPFSYAENDTNMDAYPWSRAIYTYMNNLHWGVAMPSQGPVRWHHLSEPEGDREVYVLWTRTGTEVVVDLSEHLDEDTNWVAVEPHRGHYRFVETSAIPVRQAATMLVPSDHIEQFDWLSDLDENGLVDVSDLLAMLESWSDCPDLPESCHADLNGDGSVNVDDLLRLLEDWN
ncbi:MAG: hypothetical protein VX527_01160 [Planctomycetota bacterium]|nr:hypothetical protein [Planctomycetota bacterium]